jgi:hypothetical protein
MTDRIDLVVATVGGPSLTLLLAALDGPPSHLPARVVVIDDRAEPNGPLPIGLVSPALAARLQIVTSGGRGRAAARNVCWRASDAAWVVFLDDDVVPCRGWVTELAGDLAALPADVAASRGQVRVPLRPIARRRSASARSAASRAPTRRAPTWPGERTRSVASTAFDERFLHGRREQADLALRARDAGCRS